MFSIQPESAVNLLTDDMRHLHTRLMLQSYEALS